MSDVKIHWWLYPFSWLYGLVVGIRNLLFDRGFLRERSFDFPVISIGNITVGGTGKTPHTEYLIRLLQHDHQVAVLSRGYKRKSKGFILATDTTPMEQIGDEPYQMKQKFPATHVAVNAARLEGIEQLLSSCEEKGADVVLLDDAYQHRYVKPGLSILLSNYFRPITEDALLPAGRLREPLRGKQRADIVIVTKCPLDLNPSDFTVMSKFMQLFPYQKLYFTALKYDELRPLFHNGPSRPISSIEENEEVMVLTGIASPRRLLYDLRRYTQRITPLTYPDHHQYDADDAAKIADTFHQLKRDKRIIITTEKDATRLTNLPLSDVVKQHLYVLPAEVIFLQNQAEQFNQDILNYVSTNSRNSIVFKKDHAL